MLHAARKIFSNVKSTIADEWSSVANETLNPVKPDNVRMRGEKILGIDRIDLDLE
jgi:hypothetical protein